MTESFNQQLSGVWIPTHLKALYYGPESVQKSLISCLPSENSKAFIVTGNSLATKTELIKQVELLLKEQHAGTFSKIGQHAPVAQLDEATELVLKDDNIDTVISIGGGSPIDSTKAIIYRVKEKTGKLLFHITIPTTISAAECTAGAGYTNSEGLKVGVRSNEIVPRAILYDSKFALETPPNLWITTGIRALDHSMELMYHPEASELAKMMALQAASKLFTHLPLYKQDPKNENTLTELQLAAFASLGYFGYSLSRPLGLSHTLGYALGSPYGIPHGITSCITLGEVVKFKAQDTEAARQIARMVPFIGLQVTGDNRRDAERVGQAIVDLVGSLGPFKTSLTEWGVSKEEIPIIAKRATGSAENGPVLELVRRLY